MAVQFCIHYTIEYAHFSSSLSADSCSYVYFKRMFRLRFSFRWLVDLSVACTSVLFQRYRAFIGEHDIMECITGIQDLLCIRWSFHLISYSYQLTVMGALQRLSLFGSRSSHSGGVHNDSTLGQLFFNLL